MDLGYTYGTAAPGTTAEEGGNQAGWSYLRIWRRDHGAGWKLAVEVALPLSPENPGP